MESVENDAIGPIIWKSEIIGGDVLALHDHEAVLLVLLLLGEE